MTRRERTPIVIAVLGAAIAIAGCGEDDVRYGDKQIIDKLNLEKSENGYALAGDIFCEVKKDLLNDAGQVEDASDKDSLGLVIASGEGNVGVEGVPVFSPDCKDQAKKKLNKLDPKPKED